LVWRKEWDKRRGEGRLLEKEGGMDLKRRGRQIDWDGGRKEY
jgi:hypothetical protein